MLCALVLGIGMESNVIEETWPSVFPEYETWKTQWVEFYDPQKGLSSFRNLFNANKAGRPIAKKAYEILQRLYCSQTSPDREKRLARAFATAATNVSSQAHKCDGFVNWNLNVTAEEALVLRNKHRCSMIYAAYKASKEIAESFEAYASRIATRDFNKYRNLMEKKQQFAEDLLGHTEKAEHAIIQIESGSRSCGIFAHVSALSLVPLMTFKEGAYSDRQEEARKVSDSKRYNGDNVPDIGGPGNSVRTAEHWGTQ
jgi:hypothetical protein